jgi:hypothetical protein
MKLHELTDLAHKVWGDRPGDETPFFADLERFAALVAVQVEATWQNRYLKLMDLMKAREGQPNKPCCLAEREACAKVCDDEGLHITASIIRARGQE